MRLLILGATGGIGLEAVRQAAERGHAVTALVRSPESLHAFSGRIEIITGNLLNPSELEAAIRGHDAVLSAFGPRSTVERNRRQFALALTSAMLGARVRRLLVVSVAFLFKDAVIPPAYLAGRLFFPHVVADAAEMERVVRESGLDWTIVRPPRLTDQPSSGKYRLREGHLPRFGFSVSREDVADFMIRAVENHSSIGKIVGVCH
jgi:putative NADH-flavin reductase